MNSFGLSRDQDFFLKTKNKTLLFVLEAPRDQDLGLQTMVLRTTSLVKEEMKSFGLSGDQEFFLKTKNTTLLFVLEAP